MHIEFTHARSQEYFHRRFAGAGSKVARPFAIPAAILGVLGWLVCCAAGSVRSELAAGGVLIAVAAALAGVAFLRWRQEVVVPADWREPRTYVLTDESFTSWTAKTSAKLAWSAFTWLRQEDDAYLLRTIAGRTWDIPREPLTAEQDAVLAGFLAELLAAGSAAPAERDRS
ncbi:hypothetical protein ACWT_6705 [Actinoplanes sp. SE50]|uniref:YcxB family protein n=1 Tax=unclassified Actinoplanes TaxID=2626549 RepID=UPI00023ECBDD|nr:MULTISPECIES: YcxB family protein [unclassified Actinoplanes]AEV87717.1 hypothetical protein ACPL_6835 [Actinoplanes sp. SE50/110]ATO86120.1 hypothetical protein ACWT_6705 [Actinoplanes sp. SE50]SLM03534.1 hypothetical protein ACSP50_6827 [Actinoplanes sp. SE50/110]